MPPAEEKAWGTYRSGIGIAYSAYYTFGFRLRCDRICRRPGGLLLGEHRSCKRASHAATLRAHSCRSREPPYGARLAYTGADL
jgi:hypothetical protein